MRMATLLAVVVACGGTTRPAGSRSDDAVAARFPLARLDEPALCDRLLARTEADHDVAVDRDSRTRRKVIVSDLHLGPGTSDPRFAGIEDFFSDTEWAAMLDRERAAGAVDLIVAGDLIEFWQIATALGALPRTDDRSRPAGQVLGADQAFAVQAVELVISAHPEVFRALGRLLDGGDNRVIVVAGNHDADLLWPKVQLAIARALRATTAGDPSRLVFVAAAAYQHAGVYVAHGHAHDAANRFATGHAPFGRDRDGRCRLQINWGELFVDRFYTETERQVPFIDNLYPESAAILWAVRDNPDAARDLGAAIRMLDMVRVAGKLNRDAVGAVLQEAFGGAGGGRGPESPGDVVDHVADRLTRGDRTAEALVEALLRLAYDPDLAELEAGVVAAARALPDVAAALRAVGRIDPAALARLRDVLFGEPMETAAQRVLAARDVDVVVFGHTHLVGGTVKRLARHDRAGYYANTGSWIAVASVDALRLRGIAWDRLSLADRAMFPSKTTAVIVDYDADGSPRPPIVRNAP